jgi:hypothetical protein
MGKGRWESKLAFQALQPHSSWVLTPSSSRGTVSFEDFTGKSHNRRGLRSIFPERIRSIRGHRTPLEIQNARDAVLS